ncbi:hypothetical protein FLACOL7796_01263 [Flavobacterium collinsii]|uniref:Uncharacterized protein n=1 Tax=Flavobacterium collinsii TaxID=1114861 RepID=A0ABM8KG71_9FLAO|nr:hypothetical protein FLACOL7796_01263 [Flavobacterium collinsii]
MYTNILLYSPTNKQLNMLLLKKSKLLITILSIVKNGSLSSDNEAIFFQANRLNLIMYRILGRLTSCICR